MLHSWMRLEPYGVRALMGGVGAVPLVLTGSEAGQHEVAQVLFGDDP